MKLYYMNFDELIKKHGEDEINSKWYIEEINNKECILITEETFSMVSGYYFLIKLEEDVHKVIGVDEHFYNSIDMKDFTEALIEFCRANNIKGKVQLESNYKDDKKYNELGYEFLKCGEITRWEIVCDFEEDEDGEEYEIRGSERHEWVKHKTSIYQIDIK